MSHSVGQWIAIVSRRVLVASVLSISMLQCHPSSAAVIASLTTPRETPLSRRFEADLQLQFSADLIGGDFEFLNLDIVNSSINGTPLGVFSFVEFEAAIPFDDWQDDTSFGVNPGFESQMMLDAYANATSAPFSIPDTNPITVGTFTVSYGSLGLVPGDTLTLDIVGVDDGSASMTTSLAIVEPGMIVPTLVNPTFQPGARTITVAAIPEPSASVVCLFGFFVLLYRGRRPREHQTKQPV